MADTNILIYVLRKDLRVTDNPILHHLSSTSDHGYTHLLPVYVFPDAQMDLSGLVKEGDSEGRDERFRAWSHVGHYPRCGPYRAKFIAETVWDVKASLEAIGSGLVLRAGDVGAAISTLIEGFAEKQLRVGAVWTTALVGSEEADQEIAIAKACERTGTHFKIWEDEKYFIDE
jgi:deoxyribodipyrimidine photo-lyase